MTVVFTNVKLDDLQQLSGFSQVATKGPYEQARFEHDSVTLILYTSGKLVVQGDDSFSLDGYTPKSKDVIKSVSGNFIGSDETLKGDTFGGLVVVGAYFAQDEIIAQDSKSLTDDKIMLIARDLLDKYPDRFIVKNLLPNEYNHTIAELGSVTKLLNALHQEVGLELKKKFKEQHVVDKYPGCIAGDISETKAEDKYVSVAAASIVARYYGLLQFQFLEEKLGVSLPKGSTHVEDVLKNLSKKDIELVAKLHFSNVQRILQELD